jgi:hypothetical protein
MLEAAILGDSLGFGLKLRVRLFRDQSLHLFFATGAMSLCAAGIE